MIVEKFKLIMDYMTIINNIKKLKWYNINRKRKLLNELNQVVNNLYDIDIFEFVSLTGAMIKNLSTSNNVEYHNDSVYIKSNNCIVFNIMDEENKISVRFDNNEAFIDENNFSYSVKKNMELAPFINKRWSYITPKIYEICISVFKDLSDLV